MGILVDGFGLCCLVKLQDPDNDKTVYTDVACRLLDRGSCRCSDYPNRKRRVPDCVVPTTDKIDRLHGMPSSCAYRRLADGRDLAWWHPLVSGDPESVHRAGISVRGRVVSKDGVSDDDLDRGSSSGRASRRRLRDAG